MNYTAKIFRKCINNNYLFEIIGYVSNKVYFYVV